jgi:hypothetical protein
MNQAYDRVDRVHGIRRTRSTTNIKLELHDPKWTVGIRTQRGIFYELIGSADLKMDDRDLFHGSGRQVNRAVV